MTFKTILSFAAFILLFVGCNNTIAPIKKSNIFDFQNFFNKEVNLLTVQHIGLTKTIMDGENVYSNEEKNPAWDKELQAFKTFSAIKPQQEDQYEADTLHSERGFTFITYSAANENLHLQLAEVMYNPEHTIEKITLVVKSNSKINNNDITLTYLPQKGYDIKGDVDSKVAGNHLIDVHVSCTN